MNIAPATWDKAIAKISQLDVLYEKGTVEQKRKIIGWMFPKKLVFDGVNYRTARTNDALTLIHLIQQVVISEGHDRVMVSSRARHILPSSITAESAVRAFQSASMSSSESPSRFICFPVQSNTSPICDEYPIIL